jgi:uncharacterized protein
MVISSRLASSCNRRDDARGMSRIAAQFLRPVIGADRAPKRREQVACDPRSSPYRLVNWARQFFAELGFALNPQASDERTAAIVISETTSVMLHAADWFSEFTGAAITDPTAASEVSIRVTVETRAEVDELTERALAAGGQGGGAQDLCYMYMRAFRDLDGHRWSFMYFAQMPR